MQQQHLAEMFVPFFVLVALINEQRRNEEEEELDHLRQMCVCVQQSHPFLRCIAIFVA
jgi:hypothetical protein